MKKSLLFVLSGIAVFLAVMFVFIACETGTGSSETGAEPPNTPSGSIPIPTNPAAEAAKDLANALDELGAKVEQKGTTFTLTEPLTLDSSLNVPEGTTFAVTSGVTLTVTQDGAYGGEGTIKIEAGATLVDNNKRKGDGVSYTFGNLKGPLEIAVGGEYKINASTTDAPDIRILVGKSDDEKAFFQVGTGDKVTIDGDSRTITIAAGNVDLKSPTYTNRKTLALFEGETLNIAKGATLTLTGEDSNLDLTRGDVAKGGNVVIDGTLVLRGGQLEAYKIFESGNKSTGKIEVYEGGRIVNIGARNSGMHLIVEYDREFGYNPVDSVKGGADLEKTLYGWPEISSEKERIIIDFDAKTIGSTSGIVKDVIKDITDWEDKGTISDHSFKGTLKTIGLNAEDDTPSPWKEIVITP
jgi:hypothetical protein